MTTLTTYVSAILVVHLGEDTPEEVLQEFRNFCDEEYMPFCWGDEDNEHLPLLAKYIEDKFNVYTCIVTDAVRE